MSNRMTPQGTVCVVSLVTHAAEGYTSLRCWGLTQFKRIVYIDADTLILDCIDEVSDVSAGEEFLAHILSRREM